MEYRQLGKTDMKVSTVGLGGTPLGGGLYNQVDDTEVLRLVTTTIDMGINYIDTAAMYGMGKSESRLGQALKEIPRNKFFIATKTGRYAYEDMLTPWFDFSRAKTLQSVEDSLKRLQLDYVDLIQVHDAEFVSNPDIILNETLPALQELQKAGKVRYIGITGYNLPALKNLIEKSVVPIDSLLSFCRFSLHDQSLLNDMEFYKERGVGVINASPYSMGLFTPHGPSDWHPASSHLKNQCQQAVKLCESEGVDICKLALKYSTESPDIATTIFGTSRVDELEKNVNYVTQKLSDKEQEVLNEILQKYMKPNGNMHWEGVWEKQYWERMEKN